MKLCEEYAKRICKYKFAEPLPWNSDEEVKIKADIWREAKQKEEFLSRFSFVAKEDYLTFIDDFYHHKHDLKRLEKEIKFWRKVVAKTKYLHESLGLVHDVK